MQAEQELGFRSSFNFVPEGEYTVPKSIRNELTANGFEVGVHDLKHDGKLFRSRTEFEQHARRINHYLDDWGAVGFRAGFMLRNLDWIHQLNIQYDASTFDTDPFEPQPDGAGTIFPFWIPRPKGPGLSTDTRQLNTDTCLAAAHPNGYTELPYTLPQDSTLFLVLKEKSPAIWLRKLDWIVANEGMVLLITHPDYISFNGGPASRFEFPLEHYQSLLRSITERYGRSFWHGLPRDLVRCFRKRSTAQSPQGPALKHALLNVLILFATDAANLSQFCTAA